MKFIRYGSIENITRQKTLDYIVQQGLSDGEWIVEEKIHGANMSVWYYNNKIKFAKRSSFLNENDNFYGFLNLKDQLTDFIKQLTKELRSQHVTIYGELCGGSYPHPDVKKDNNSIKVQNGVYYHPQNIFYVFDVVVGEEYQPQKVFEKLSDYKNICVAQTLFRGTLQQCMEYNNEYQTVLPEQFGLPPIDNNICEGNVIKPVIPKFLANGSRVTLKNKNEKFLEKESRPKKLKETPKQLRAKYPHVFRILDIAISYVTENRLRNVISKIGQINNKEFGKLLGLFVRDVLEDFYAELTYEDSSIITQETNRSTPAMNREEEKVFNKQLNSICGDMIRSNFVNIIDGNF